MNGRFLAGAWSNPLVRDSAYGLFESARLSLRDGLIGVRALGAQTGRRILCNSFPKSGTHLLYEVLQSVEGAQRWEDIVTWMSLSGRANSQAHVRRKLASAPPGAVVRAHLPYSDDLKRILDDLGYVVVTVVRDPRDVAVSIVHWVRGEPRHYLHTYFNQLEFSDAVMATIVGVPIGAIPWSSLSLPGIVDDMPRWEGWKSDTQAAVVRFEDLVGPRGGSTVQRQLVALREIAQSTGWDERQVLGESERYSAADGRDSHTFRQGRAHAWDTVLEPQHLEVFARRGGDRLLESWGYS